MREQRHVGNLIRAALLFPLLAGWLLAQSGKLARDLAGLPPSASTDVIVQFTTGPPAEAFDAVTARGGTIRRAFRSFPGASFSVPAGQLAAIAAHPLVRYISPDRKVSASLEFANPTVSADIARGYGWNGQGIGIAIIDSGVSSSADLRDSNGSRIVYSQNFVPGETGSGDVYGHGTHVAGVAAGNGANSSGGFVIYTFRGIAPRANLINLRVLDANGQGTDSTVIAAIDRAIELKNQYNIRVLNLSLGRPIYESHQLDPLCRAVERAWQSGLVAVVSAGNNGRDNSMNTQGYSTIASPGNSPYAITAGAMRDMGTATRVDDLIASYSSKGPTLRDQIVKPDLVAPGNGIISVTTGGTTLTQRYPGVVVPQNYYKAGPPTNSQQYMKLSGTSMAAPMVSGAAALLLQKDPSLTPDHVKARLMKTATKAFPPASFWTDPATGVTYTTQYDLFAVGAGYLDVWAALNNSDPFPAGRTAMSPRAVYDSKKRQVRIVIDSSVVWGDSLVWGTSLVWGAGVLSGSAVVWGDSVVWGNSASQGFSVVWGDSVVWGTGLPFPESLTVTGDR